MTHLDCLHRRFAALAVCDYAAVYESYHVEAPFRCQFADADQYRRYADEHLAGIRVTQWRCTMERSQGEGRVECLLLIDLDCEGAAVQLAELALLINAADGWRYHSAQKLDLSALGDLSRPIDFSRFDEAPEKVRF